MTTCIRCKAIRTTTLNAEAVKGREGPLRSEFENRATATGGAAVAKGAAAAISRCPVEVPVGSLDQSRDWDSTVAAVKRVRLYRARKRDFVYGPVIVPVPALAGSPVEVAVRALDQTGVGKSAVGKVEIVQCDQSTLSRDLEDRPRAEPSLISGPVEAPINSFNQPSLRSGTVGAARLVAKTVEGRQGAARSDLENCATRDGTCAVLTAPTLDRRSIEVPIGGLNQPCDRDLAVGTVRPDTKAVERGQLPAWRDFEHRALVAGPASTRYSVEVPVNG